MATIQGRECEVIGWADTGLYCITSKHGGRLNERLEWNHDVMSNFCLSFPTRAAAQAFIEQHCDKPATPAAESDSGECERLRCKGCGKELLAENCWMQDGCPCNTPRGVNDGNQQISDWRQEREQKASYEIEKLSTELAAARAERDEAVKDAEALVNESAMRLKRAEKAEAERDAAVGVWRDISTAPKDGTLVDLWIPRRRERAADCRFIKGGWRELSLTPFDTMEWCSLEGYDQPTHWMPLPEPPTAKGAGRE